jgi:hypothetical protein
MTCIVTSAWRVGKSGDVIEDELPWMSGTAARHLAELARARGRALAHAIRFASGMSEQSGLSAASAKVNRDRAHVLIVVAIALLPPPYAQAMTLLHVDGIERGQVARWLMTWGGIGPHGARKILREGRGMLEVAVLGQHPRRRWPKRFPGNPRWRSTPPLPERQQ